MSVDKLQKIVPAAVEAKYKARWLKWWNSSPSARMSYKFVPSEFKDNDLDSWLNKASFWAGVILIKNPFHFLVPLNFYQIHFSMLLI